MISFAGVRLRTAAAVALSVLASGSGIALMATSAWLLSRAAEHPPVMYLMVAIVAVRAFGLSRAVFRYLERLVGHDVALRLQGSLRQTVYRRLTSSSWVGRRSADLLSRVVLDVEAVQDLVVRVLIPFLSAAVVITTTCALLALVSPAAALATLASAVVAGALVPWLSALGSRTADRSMAPLRAELASVTAEVAAAAVDLAAYGADAAMLDRLDAVQARLLRAERRTAWVRGLTTAAQLVAAGTAVLGALVIGSLAVAAGSLSAVFLAVLVLTPVALHESLAVLPAAAQAWTTTTSALRRVSDLVSAPPVGRGDAVARPATGGPPLLLADVTLGWPGEPPVLEQLSLQVSRGERVALVGPSGSGKTTVAAALMGMIDPVSGSVEVSGRVGYLAQDAYLFDTTVAENVRVGRPDATDSDVRQALDRVGLDLELDRRVGEHGAALSGGEARRVALARLMLEDHEVLILDEPTEHLDRVTAAALTDDLWRLSTGTATVIITHDPILAERCDRVVALTPWDTGLDDAVSSGQLLPAPNVTLVPTGR